MANNNGNNDQLKAKRKRSANWDTLEKNLLKSCMKEFVSIIENKNTDTNTNKSKTIAWQTVSKRFNELNNRERDLTEVKQQWRTMKLDAKKKMSQIKKSIKCTGGGPKPASPDLETMEILSMIPQEFETDSNVFDSDSTANLDNTTQEYVLTPFNNEEDLVENITPIPVKNIEPKNLFKTKGTKRKLPLNEIKQNGPKDKHEEKNLANERNHVLLTCIREEHDLKLRNMIEDHSFIKEEHDLKLRNMIEVHSFIKEEHNLKTKQMYLEKEKTELLIEKLKLEMLMLKSKLP